MTEHKFSSGCLGKTDATGKYVPEIDPTTVRQTLSNRLLNLRYGWSSDTSRIVHSTSEDNHFKARSTWSCLIGFSCDLLIEKGVVTGDDVERVRSIQEELTERLNGASSIGERIKTGDEILDRLICVMGD